MITISNLTKLYNKKTVVFKNFNYILSNNLCLLIGPNGSGKTTLLNCITDYIRYQGVINYNGCISYLPELRGFDEDVIANDLLKLISRFYQTNINEYLHKLNFEGFLTKRISDLSKGNKTKLYILSTLAKPADIFIFDEPTDGLDISAKEELINFCLELSKTHQVIISTHDLGVIDRLKNVQILDLSKVEKCIES